MKPLTACLLVFVALQANAQSLWRIGNFDRTSTEFADGSPDRPVNFLAGQSNPARDWYAVQPVQSATGTAPRSAPWTIQFLLQQLPAASYQLHIALLLEAASVPTLEVSINGKKGKFYLHAGSNTDPSDHNGASDAVISYADVQFTFPGSYLHQGANILTVQPVEEAAKFVPEASLTYDAIELSSSNAAADTHHSSVSTEPTVFYQRHNGHLVELVDCTLHYIGQPVPHAAMDLLIEGHHDHRSIPRDHDFGEQKLEFALPEFSAHSPIKLSWNLTGHREHSQQTIDPAKQWTLYLIPHIHLDIGYSDYQAKVAAIQSRVIDEALQLTAQHPNFRFSLDGEWSLEQFLATRTSTEQQRAIAAIQKQQLFVPAQYASLLTGFPTAELLIRSLYPSQAFSRLHQTPFNYANITDVPSYSWSYASVLAAAGIHQLLAGSDNFRAPVFFQGHLNQHSPIWWQGPDGEKVLLWYARHYQQMQFLFGLPPVAQAGRETLPVFLQQYQLPTYRAHSTIIFGTQAENTDLFPQQAELVDQWNSLYQFPHLQYAGVHEALATVAAQFGDGIPTISGDGGPYWEDGIASDARYAAIERENESRGPSAEKLSTLASLIDPRLAPNTGDLTRMWRDMLLMDEHTWDASDSVVNPASEETREQLTVKHQYAFEAQQLAASVLRSSMATIADSIAADADSLVVFNTLNWKRSQLVSVDVANWLAQIVDSSTGQSLPTEVTGGGKDFRRVRFLAENIPAFGYKVYRLRDTDKAPAAAPATQQTVLQNAWYRVQLDPQTGALRSVYDKQLQRELVDQQTPYRFGQYLYATGGDQAPNSLLQYSQLLPPPKLAIHPAHDGHLVSVTRTAWGWVARMESSATNTPHIATELQLFDNEKKIEIDETVEKTEVDTKEAAYFAFPFAIEHPKFQYEIQDGVVDPAHDAMPGAGHEWFSVQHWVTVEDQAASFTLMPLDASLVTLGDLNRGAWPTDFGVRPASIFSYVMNNYWTTNYRAGQGGAFHFRYVLTSAPATDAPRLSRLGWQEMTPLEINRITTQDKAQPVTRPLSGRESSFLQIDDPTLVLTAWKPAQDGNGTILRFLDLGAATRTVTVHTPSLHLKEAWQSDAVERDQQRLPLAGDQQFDLPIHPHQIVTIRVLTTSP